MKILAIESSCDETAAAVVENGRRVLSSVVATQVEEHKLYGGVVPEIASRRHSEAIVGVVREALERAELTVNDLDAIGVTYAPGLIGALLVGVNFAKGLSLSANLPLIPVHHLRSHIASNYITNPELEPPFLCLVVSGGHTHIIEVTDYTKLRILGKTRDDAAGEAFDKAARAMGMPYPGGIAMDKLAETGNDKAFKLPRPTVDGAPLDFSFSGLKTAVINILHNAEQRARPSISPIFPPLTARPLSIASCATFCTPQTRPAIKSSSSRAASLQTHSCAAASRKNASVPAARSICPTSLSPATTPPWSAHRPTTNISPAIPPAWS